MGFNSVFKGLNEEEKSVLTTVIKYLKYRLSDIVFKVTMCTRIAYDQNLYVLVNVTKEHHMHV